MIEEIKYNDKNVLSVKINGGTFFSATKSPLPSGYRQLTGVHFSGNSYFTTDINASSDSIFYIHLEFMPTENITTNMYIFGANSYPAPIYRAGTLNMYGTNIFQVICGGATTVVYSYSSTDSLINKRFVYENSIISTYTENELKTQMIPAINDINMVYNTAANNYKPCPMPDTNFTLGTAQYTSSQTYYRGNVYRMTLYNSAEQIIADWYPAQRKSDSAIGFYDTIANQFYTPTVGTVSTIS